MSSATRVYLNQWMSKHGDATLDCVTIKGAKEMEVPQVNGEWPPFAMVQASQTIPRQPFGDSDTKALNQSMRWDMFEMKPARPGEKWCSDGDHWASTARFSPRADSWDGLSYICKDCKNAHDRKMRYAVSYAASGTGMRGYLGVSAI